jgi:hypothetical protein
MSLSPLFTILKSQILHVRSKKCSDHCHRVQVSGDIRSNSGNAELRCCNGRGDQELDRQNAEDFADKAISYSNVVYPCQLLAASKCFKHFKLPSFLLSSWFKLFAVMQPVHLALSQDLQISTVWRELTRPVLRSGVKWCRLRHLRHGRSQTWP